MISGLIAKGFDLTHWLASQMGLDPGDNFKEYFALHPLERKGKMVLVIDSIDQITDRANKFNELMESLLTLIALNDETPWFKIILSMRCATWSKLQLLGSNSPLIKSQWYHVGFHTHAKTFINVPLLSYQERTDILLNIIKQSKILSKIENVRKQIVSHDLYEYISMPIYFESYIKKLASSEANITTPVELLIDLHKTYIANGKYAEEKQRIIDNFLNFIEYDLESMHVRKKDLVETIESRFAEKAYEELVSIGIISEENHYNKFGTQTTYVTVEYPFFFSYLIAVKVLVYLEKPSILNYKYFLWVNIDQSLKKMGFRWLIFFAFYLKDYELIFKLKYIIKELEEKNEEYSIRDNPFINDMINTIGICLRLDSEARNFLMERFASDTLWQQYYFESFLDHDHITSYYGEAVSIYSLYKRDTKGIIYSHVIQLLRFTLTLNFERARIHLEILDSIDPYIAMKEPYAFAISIAFKTMYFHIFYKKIPDSCFDILLHMVDELPVSIGNYRFAIFASTVAVVLNYAGDYFNTLRFWGKVHKKYEDLKNKKHIVPEEYLLMILVAEAYIETGYLKEGNDILLSFIISDIDMHKQMFRIAYDQAVAKFDYYTGNFQSSYIKLKTIDDITTQLKLFSHNVKNAETINSIEKSIKVEKNRMKMLND
jgi:hypothetical protein